MLQLSTILMAAVFGLAAADDAKVSPPATGAIVPDFSLKDIHRRSRSLADFKDKKAFVVIFLDTECPVAALYVPGLIEWHRVLTVRALERSPNHAFLGARVPRLLT